MGVWTGPAWLVSSDRGMRVLVVGQRLDDSGLRPGHPGVGLYKQKGYGHQPKAKSRERESTAAEMSAIRLSHTSDI